MRVAFLTLYPVETASTRQRIHKNVRHFPADLEAVILPGITPAALRRLERRGAGSAARLLFLLEEVGRKLWHLWRARAFDVVVVQKGLTVMNLRGLPRLLRALGKPVVFDFDDAVHLGPPQAFRSRWLRRLTAPAQVAELMRQSAVVVAGNRHLAEVAAAHAPAVEVISTPMDGDWYRPRSARSAGRVVVGWSGSSTTNHYVGRLAPIVRRLAEQADVELRVISSDDRGIDWTRFAPVPTSFVPWSLERLVDDLLAFDIGVMPLDDDEWSRSKCGGKLLQYMACGIPAVASPVGINREVVREGETGFLAGPDAEWVEKLLRLARDPGLRERIGRAAREQVLAAHTNRVLAPRLVEVIRRAAYRPDRPARVASAPDQRPS